MNIMYRYIYIYLYIVYIVMNNYIFQFMRKCAELSRYLKSCLFSVYRRYISIYLSISILASVRFDKQYHKAMLHDVSSRYRAGQLKSMEIYTQIDRQMDEIKVQINQTFRVLRVFVFLQGACLSFHFLFFIYVSIYLLSIYILWKTRPCGLLTQKPRTKKTAGEYYAAFLSSLVM